MAARRRQIAVVALAFAFAACSGANPEPQPGATPSECVGSAPIASLDAESEVAEHAAASIASADGAHWTLLANAATELHAASIGARCRNGLGCGHFRLRRRVYRIATNYCLNELCNRAGREQNDWDEVGPKDDGFDDTFVTKDYAQRLLNSLPPRVRSIAWLALVDGLRQDEIARELGLSGRTVTSRMRELRARVNALTRARSS